MKYKGVLLEIEKKTDKIYVHDTTTLKSNLRITSFFKCVRHDAHQLKRAWCVRFQTD